MIKPDAVIMASGFSKRMGRNKLLLDIGGKPVITRLLERMPYEMFRKVVVVYSDVKVSEACVGFQVETVLNKVPNELKSGTIRQGVEACSSADGLMFFVADQPCIKRDTIETLLSIYDKNSEKIVIPICNGKQRNPVIFPKGTLHELADLSGDEGGRVVIKKHPELSIYIGFDEPEQFLDVDTEEDYERVKRL